MLVWSFRSLATHLSQQFPVTGMAYCFKHLVSSLQESLNQQVEEREVEIAKMKETSEHLVSQRDDAVDAIAEKDSQINTLRRQLEQVQYSSYFIICV